MVTKIKTLSCVVHDSTHVTAKALVMAVKSNLIPRRRVDLEEGLKMIVVEVECHDAPNLLFANFYRPPDCSRNFVDKFASFLNKSEIARSNRKLVLVGDFNFPKINWPTPCFTPNTSDGFHFCETLHYHNLTQIVTSPTRISTNNSSSTILDLIITNFPEHVQNLELLTPNEIHFQTDHSLLVFDVTIKLKNLPKSSRMIYDYRNAHLVGLRNTLKVTDFQIPDDKCFRHQSRLATLV